MNLEASAFKKTGTSTSALTLTGNDVKILGKLLEKKRERTLPPKQFHTRLFKTHNSNWTPVVHKPSNDKIFTERLELISNWFDMWTALQRRDFFDIILLHCTKKQLFYIQNWFDERVPLRHLDFTTVLPRFLSLYIFSFLDPRSLSRASMVSWHWKFLTEQNILWTPKCLRHGWFLPFNPSPYEFGTWKHHYVACLMSMDAEAGGTGAGALTIFKAKKGAMSKKLMKSGKGGEIMSTRKALHLLWPHLGKEILDARPPWLPPDRYPHDIDKTEKAFLAGFNPNDPKIHPSLLLYHTQFGTWKSQLRQSAPALVRMRLMEAARKADHHLLQENVDPELEHEWEPVKATLSRSLQLENNEERRLMELQGMTSDPPMPPARLAERRPDLSGGTQYPLPWAKCAIESRSKKMLVHPRILLVSSHVSASEMLVDASLCDVIPIAYDYEATTLESLLHRLDLTLQGRQARSIGIFTHVDGPGMLCLLRDITVSSENLMTTPDLLHFFKKVATHVVTPSDGGHIDLFVPLHACESGTELVSLLNLHTGLAHGAPSSVTKGYNYINSEWVLAPEGVAPTVLYFCRDKLSAWMNIAEHADEACRALSTHVRKYFGQSSRDVVAKVVGQIVFDATGLARIGDIESISQALVDGLVHAGQEQSAKDPFQTLGKYFLSLSKQNSKAPKLLAADADDMFAVSYVADDDVLLRDTDRDDITTVAMDRVDGSMATIVESDDDEEMDEEKSRDVLETLGETRKNLTLRNSAFAGPKKSASGPTQKISFKLPSHHDRDLEGSSLWRETIGSYGNGVGRMVDRREAIARDILSSELDYLRTLEAIQKVFFAPCEAALAANRAIISAPNLQLIFNDILLLLDLSSVLVSDLQGRLSSWHGQQCLGDVFVKFTLKLKAYTNFLKVYPLVLRTIEKCVEQGPLFRAFLKRHERTAASKMLTLPELLLAPSQRIGDYIALLTSYQHLTFVNHVDCTDVTTALNRFMELNQLIQQCKLRGEQERHLVKVQKKIIKCPILLEANRFFIKQLDVSGLQTPSNDVIRELRVYRHVENLGLFLFNDSLVVTKRTVKHLPFERRKEEAHVFVECCQLTRLRVEDIPDSKYVSNAFRMHTPKRQWFCGVESPQEKLEWISVLEKTIQAALEDVD